MIIYLNEVRNSSNVSWPLIRLSTLLILFLSLFHCFSANGQTLSEIDSLQEVLATTKKDTTWVKTAFALNEKIFRKDTPASLELMLEVEDHIKEKLQNIDSTTQHDIWIFYHKALAKSLFRIGMVHMVDGPQSKAEEYMELSLKTRKSIDDLAGVSHVINTIARLEIRKGNEKKAKELFWESLTIREELGDQFHIAGSCSNMSMISNRLGDFNAALDYAMRALKIRQELNEIKWVGISYNDIGLLFNSRGMTDKASFYYLKAIETFEQINDQNLLSFTLNNLGYVFLNLDNLERAKNHFERSLAIRRKEGTKTDVAGSLNNLGKVYFYLKDYRQAKKFQEESLQLRKEIGNPIWISDCLLELGEIYLAQNAYQKALEYFDQSLDICKKIKDKRLIAHRLHQLSETHRKRGNIDKALSFSKEAIELAKEVDNLNLLSMNHYSLYQNYKEKGNMDMALRMYENHIANRDTIQNRKNRKEVIRQQYAYEYEKRTLADSIQNAEFQKIASAELAAQKAQNAQERQQSLIIGIALLTILLLSGVVFYIRRKNLQKRLQREQEEAQRLKELDTFKSRLFTNLTHEFRTPLTVILGMAEKVRAEPKTFLKTGTQLIERNGKNLLRLINQLLDLSKMENKSFQLQYRQADIISYLHYVTESFHSFANGRNLSLRFFSPLESLTMDYDVEQIKQVMTNLISNAIKFTPSGGEVHVRLKQKENWLKIEVSDTGIGIPKENLSKVFDRFYQVDSSSTKEQEGTGIGLAHTKELLKLMNGEISVQSNIAEENRGSIFTVLLPITNVAPLLEDLKKTTLSIPEPNANYEIEHNQLVVDTEQPTVLIVEDNADVVTYLKSCLKNDYQLEVAYNGSIGIEKAIELVPDLIVSDVMMPGKDGFEVCNILKNDERTSHIPIVLLTAKADLVSKLTGLERGADAYLAKPFHPEELNIRLEKLLMGRQKMRDYFSKQYIKDKGRDELFSKDVIIEDAFLQKVNAILERNISDEDFGLPQLRQKIRMSRSQFFRKIKALTNTAPSDYLRTYRLNKSKSLLEDGNLNVSEVAYQVGFKDPSYFSKIFKEEFGFMPSVLKK